MNERHMAYVCMGSNMGEPETNLARAREVLGALPGWKIEASSPVYFTEPQDMRDQSGSQGILRFRHDSPRFFGYAA